MMMTQKIALASGSLRRFAPRLSAAALAIALCAPFAHGFTRSAGGSGSAPVYLSWSSDTVTYVINDQTSSALANIEAGSDPISAVRRSFQNWGDVETSRLAPTYGGTTSATSAGYDGSNVVTFVDTGFAYNGALAVAQYWYSTSTGEIVEADVVFNPSVNWSTMSGASNVYDIEEVGTHEVGHFFGLAHSGSMSATMYPYGKDGSQTERRLDSDDITGMSEIYPKPSFQNQLGAISGTVTRGGTATFGAHIVAVDANGRPYVSTVSIKDGTYTLVGLPAGNYQVYAEPLDKPVQQGNLGGYWSSASFPLDYLTEFYGGNTTPTTIAVAAGTTVTGVDIDCTNTTPTINPRMIGRQPAGGGGFSVSSTVMTVKQGEVGTWNIVIAGEGLTSPTTFEIMGSQVTRTSNFSYGTFGSGLPYVKASFDFAAAAEDVPRVIRVERSDEAAAITAAIEILPSEPKLSFEPDPLDPDSMLIRWYGETATYLLMRDTQSNFLAASSVQNSTDQHYSDVNAWTDGQSYFYRLE